MNTKALLYGLIVILVLSLVLGYLVLVQTAWSLEGKVIDYNEEPIPHATVTFTNYEESFKIIADENGHYVIPNNALKSMEEGKYHVMAIKNINKEDFVGYEGDYEVEQKNAKFDISFKNKVALGVHKQILEVMKGKFGDLRPTPYPIEPESTKMKYESKSESAKDTVDLKDLGDYYIELSEDKSNGNIIHINLKYGGKVVEEGDVVLNCSLFMGWTRPEGYHEELLNSIGLDEVKNRLTKDDGVIKIWTKYAWLESGDRFSDVIISPLNIFNQRTGNNKAFFSFTDGLGYKFTEIRPQSGESGASAPPTHEGQVEGVEVDLSELGEYTLLIERKGINKVCINLMKGDELVEKAMCINDTNFWMTKGEISDDGFRRGNIFPDLQNTLGLVGVGKMIDKDTIELSKDDGIIYMAVAKAYVPECIGDCKDTTIISKSFFAKYCVEMSREFKDDKNIVWFKVRGMLG